MKKYVVDSRIVHDDGLIKITAMTVSDEAKAGLSTGSAKLPPLDHPLRSFLENKLSSCEMQEIAKQVKSDYQQAVLEAELEGQKLNEISRQKAQSKVQIKSVKFDWTIITAIVMIVCAVFGILLLAGH